MNLIMKIIILIIFQTLKMKLQRRSRRKRYSYKDNNRNRKILERILMSCLDPLQINPQVDGKDSKDLSKLLSVVPENKKQEKSVKEVQGTNNLVI